MKKKNLFWKNEHQYSTYKIFSDISRYDSKRGYLAVVVDETKIAFHYRRIQLYPIC